jgi:hypothetical protein
MLSRALSSLVVIVVTALLGLSFARLAAADPLPAALGGAAVGLIAVLAGYLSRHGIARVEQSRSPRKWLGLKVGVVAFCVAIFGWLVAVFVAPATGQVISFIGIIGGVVGMAIHWLYMLQK